MLSARVAASEGALSCPATQVSSPCLPPVKHTNSTLALARGCSFRAAALSEFGCSSRVWRDPCSQRCALPHSSLGSKQCCSAAGLRVRLLPGAEPCRPPPPSLRRTVRHAQLEPRTVNDPSMPAPPRTESPHFWSDSRLSIFSDLREPADISAAVLPDFSQKHAYLHFHGRGGTEDANPNPGD